MTGQNAAVTFYPLTIIFKIYSNTTADEGVFPITVTYTSFEQTVSNLLYCDYLGPL